MNSAWLHWTKGWSMSWAGQYGTARGGARFHQATKNSMQFKTCQSFLSGSFHSILSGLGWLWVTETKEHETMDKGQLLSMKKIVMISTSLDRARLPAVPPPRTCLHLWFHWSLTGALESLLPHFPEMLLHLPQCLLKFQLPSIKLCSAFCILIAFSFALNEQSGPFLHGGPAGEF